AERLVDQRRVEDRGEVAGTRPGRQDPEPDPDQARRDGAPAEPPPAARQRPDAQKYSDQSDQDRPDHRPRLDRRNREKGREGAEDDPGATGQRRVAQARAEGIVEPSRPGVHAAASGALTGGAGRRG